MKKIFMFSIMLLGLLIFNNSVNAACGAGVYVDGELICLVTGATGGNKAGTAYVEDSTLVLNNYNGGNIKYFSGIGNPSKEEIKLIGDNYITSEDSYGILSLLSEISFVGNGTLTIKSKMPFLYYDWGGVPDSLFFDNNEVSIITIISGETKSNIEKFNPSVNNQNSEIKQEIIEENTEKQEELNPSDNNKNNELQEESSKENTEIQEEINNETKDKNDIILLVSLGFSILCLIVIIVLVIENIKLRKNDN